MIIFIIIFYLISFLALAVCRFLFLTLVFFALNRLGFFSHYSVKGRGNGLEVEPISRNPEGRGSIPHLGSRRSSLISIEHAELLRSTPLLVLCCAWLVYKTLHVLCGLGQLSPLPTSGDDIWVAAKHCGRAKRSRISDTHRLRSSLQFRYINNQSSLYFL